MALHYFKTVLPVLPSTTLQAAAADIVVDNHVLSITGLAPMDYRKIESGSNLAPVAETLGVWTVTPTAANSADFGFVIEQFVEALGRLVVEPVFHTTPTTGGTATTICNAFRAQIRLMKDVSVTVNADGNPTLVITAKTRSPLFTVTPTSSNTAAVNTTPGVHSRGTYADLIAAGVSASIATAGATYNTVSFVYGALAPALLDGNTETEINSQILFVNIAATNFAAFNTRMDEVMNAFAAGTVLSDPELISMQ